MSSVKRIVLVAGLAAGAGVALADGVLYALVEDSYCRRDHCVGPCDCIPWSEEGPLSGTFVLTPDHEDPIYSYYTVSAVDWHVDGDMGPIELVGGGTFQIGGEFAVMQAMTLDLVDDVEIPDRVESGLVPAGAVFPEIRITVRSSPDVCTQATIDIHAAPVEACYADCDANEGLDLFDFLCFQNAFAGGEGYADCDGSGALDLFDFLCFQNAFVGGC